VAACLLFAGIARAQESAQEDGLFLSVGNPITDSVMYQVTGATERALRRADRHIRKIVYDFNPGSGPSASAQYGSCRDLAEYLLRLRRDRRATTIAFVHNKVSRHTLLPVLACDQLVLSPDARLGNDPDEPIESLARDQVEFYREVAVEGRHCSPAIVLKMFDKNMEVFEGWQNGSLCYVDRVPQADGDRVRKGDLMLQLHPALPPLFLRHAEDPKTDVLIKGRVAGLQAGKVALYTAADAKQYGLHPIVLNGRSDGDPLYRQQVAQLYGLSPTSLHGDPLQGRKPVAVRIEVRGPITKEARQTLERRIRRAVGQGHKANLLFLHLECSGGDLEQAAYLAKFLHDLKDDRGELPVMTVAYIPQRAPDTATFVAFGCTEIVMHKDAVLGDFESVVYTQDANGNRKDVDAKEYKEARESLVALAEAQGYPVAVVEGMFDRQRTIRWDELQTGPDGQSKWRGRGVLKPGGADGQPLKLDANLAQELGVARHVVASTPELYAYYDAETVEEIGPDWLDDLAWFLRHPIMDVILVLVGITCLILELKMPGIGIPAVIAAVCFVLFFWAHSQLAGQITMLAVLLFVLGLLLIGLEVFLIPGFGVAGVSGILLVLIGLGLVTLEKKPETTAEWLDFGQTLAMFGGCLLGALVSAYVLARYLPHLPYAHRLVLVPPAEKAEAAAVEAPGAGAPVHAALLGAIGVAVTTLRPAGMARFGDDFVDVVAEGSYVNPGARVQVIEIEGNRIVVKELE
jgi:membrane-bound ClpP family serine protease